MFLVGFFKFAFRKLEIDVGQDESRSSNQAKDQSKHGVDLEGEDEEGEQHKTPDDEVEPDSVVELGGHCSGRIGLRSIRQAKLKRRKLEQAERQPEDGVQAHSHHGEEVAHDPFEDHGKQQQDRPDEEEYSANRGI